MASPVPYSLALAGLILIASLSMLGLADKTGDEDNCLIKLSCRDCVITKLANKTEGNNGTTCVWEFVASGARCVAREDVSEIVHAVVHDVEFCRDTPTTVAPNTTTSSTTTEPPTNGTTTVPTTPSTTPPPTNGTTTTTTTVAPSTNGTTTTAPPTTTTPSNGTTTPTTSAPPTTSTTAPPKPTPTPSKGGFSWASFIGGIVFAAALSSLAYLIWRFYKVRLDRNYHTL